MHGRDPSRWQAHLQRIEQEGIGTKVYAQREGLDVKALYADESRRNFKRRVIAPMAADDSASVSRKFLELRLYHDSSKDADACEVSCCLVLPSGVHRPGDVRFTQHWPDRGSGVRTGWFGWRVTLMHPGYAIGSVYLHRDPIDFRKQINGLADLVRG